MIIIFSTTLIILMSAVITHSTELKPSGKTEIATFAGGCFWCMEPPFIKLDGVISTTAGYTGGHTKNPTYTQVSEGITGHAEAVEVIFNPDIISYSRLLKVFWRNIDPTAHNSQFVDNGSQYRSAIFYHNDTQKKLATESKEELERSGRFSKPIVTEITKASDFYRAEDYHQSYYKKASLSYKTYRLNSGRDQYLEKTWGDENTVDKHIDPQQLRKSLTPLQYKVTMEKGTEKAFENEYWNNKKEGIYVDIIDGTPLFSSKDKYDSGTGWPSFSKPIDTKNIEQHMDKSFFTERTEVKSSKSGSHLGHVFPDGPLPTKQRYCLNSASLRFVPIEEMEKEGYKEYLKLFNK